jgi:hypothetical protein
MRPLTRSEHHQRQKCKFDFHIEDLPLDFLLNGIKQSKYKLFAG